MPRIALGIEYAGSNFHGWQRQSHAASVQGVLEKALANIACQPIETFCAGRTDAGVHALEQVVHFDTSVIRPLRAWHFGTNVHLPPSVRVLWAKEVSDDFHARFSATAREYDYWILNRKTPSAIAPKTITWHPHALDEEKMHRAAQYFLGEQDFTSVRASECQSRTPFRNVHHARVYREGDRLCFNVKANAFLHHMVRNMTGVLLEIGQGVKPVEWVAELLAQKDRRLAPPTAKPHGLYLTKVYYASPE